MKTKLFTLFVALVTTTALWASNTITYIATEKLRETTTLYSFGLHTNGFNVSMSSHTFNDGVGTITFAEEVQIIGEMAFYGCRGLTSITIPNSVTTIGKSAFSMCTSLTSVTIPNSVITIESSAFSNCSGLTSVEIPNSVTTIENSAFTYVPNITYNGTATGSPWGAKCVNGYVEEYFVYSDATKTTLCGCSSAAVGEITIPNSVTTIGERAFFGCFNPISVTISNSVTTIENHSFQGCTGLTSITIPNSVTTIVDGAFQECTKLTSITIPYSVTTIKGSAFYMCTSLASIIVESGNAVYDNRENCNAIVETATNTLILGCKNTIIPNSVTTIGDGAFMGCKGLTSITIPSSVTTIESSVFYECTGLTFITIPKSVTKIGDNVFMNCSGLFSITCYAITPPECGIYVFKGIRWDAKVYVPASAVEDYQKAEEWKDLQLYPIAAEVTPMDGENPIVTPTDQDVTITWPITDGTDTYTLTITKNGEVVCVLTFNANGQLTNIAFAAPGHNGAHQAPAATLTAQGYQFTVTGLNPGTTYNYNVTATDAGGKTIAEHKGNFSTIGGESDLQNVRNGVKASKYFHNGNLIIERNGVKYTPAGQKVR